jgi:hypothetical protein
MRRLGNLLRTRLLPGLLVAAGVGAVTAGLVSLPEPVGALPTGSPGTGAVVTPAPAGSPVSSPSLPVGSVAPPSTVAPTASAARVATRVAIPALDVDMPVILPPGGTSTYPLCDVAMYLRELGQPGQGRAIYLYAHAREGMFLPLLSQSEVDEGAGMLGMVVQVWTSDEQVFLYEISEVRRHATDLDDAVMADREQLWLQTSEGPRGTVPKLQVIAEPLSNGPAANPADAHPVPRPTECA